jgi:putative flippase GtrA
VQERQRQFFRFAAIGVIGFMVDAGVIALLVRVMDVGAYQARLPSYFFAVATTWWFNRRFTFGSTRPPLREFLEFVAANAFGAAINLGAYATLIAWLGSSGWIPIAAVAVGSLAGLTTNFMLSSRVVFSARRLRGSTAAAEPERKV